MVAPVISLSPILKIGEIFDVNQSEGTLPFSTVMVNELVGTREIISANIFRTLEQIWSEPVPMFTSTFCICPLKRL